jgi:hypothetical protein
VVVLRAPSLLDVTHAVYAGMRWWHLSHRGERLRVTARVEKALAGKASDAVAPLRLSSNGRQDAELSRFVGTARQH